MSEAPRPTKQPTKPPFPHTHTHPSLGPRCRYACDPQACLTHSPDDTRLNAESEEVKAWFKAAGPPPEGKQPARTPLPAWPPTAPLPCARRCRHATRCSTAVYRPSAAALTAGSYSFICECFFMTARALQLGLGKGARSPAPCPACCCDASERQGAAFA